MHRKPTHPPQRLALRDARWLTAGACLKVAAWLTAGALLGGAAAAAAAAPSLDSPVGVWKTFDDHTGKPKGVVRIYPVDGKLFARVEQSFVPGADQRVCVLCTDERKDQPIIGLIIMRDMRPDGAEYDGGDILDPETGSIYHCKMHVTDNGTHLVLRGYIGISLLGRSQTWLRQE